MDRRIWEQGKCRGEDSFMLVETDEGGRNKALIQAAKALCLACPVRARCLRQQMYYEGGLPQEFRWGVYGGLDEIERWKLRRLMGCVSCGAPLDQTRMSLYCDEHRRQHRDPVEQAVRRWSA